MERSVAAVLKDDGGVAGTAFLFRKEAEYCCWFTCHHVISHLKRLRLGLNFSSDQPPEPVDAEYLGEYSDPERDVAVLKTPLAGGLEDYEALLMGDVKLAPTQTVDVGGIGFTPRNIKNYITGQVFEAKLTYGQLPQFFIHKEAAAEAIRKLGNPWNVPLPRTRSRVFNLVSSTAIIEGGFSGSPVCLRMDDGRLLCVGMVNQANKAIATSGTAITYGELFEAAGTAIPFYPYAQCVIIVVAAKCDEIRQGGGDFGPFSADTLAPNYDSLRNRWRVFDDEADVGALLETIPHRRTWQLATVYLDDLRELEEFMRYTPQALFFIVDSCSLGVPALKNVIAESDNQFFRAAYLFPMCDIRFDGRRKELLRGVQQAHMPRVLKSAWIRKRVKECFRRQDFLENVVLMIEEAVKQSMRLHEDEVGRMLERVNLPPEGMKKLPPINMRPSGRD